MHVRDIVCQAIRLRIESNHDPDTWLHNVAPPLQCTEPAGTPDWRLRVMEAEIAGEVDRDLPNYFIAGTSTFVSAWTDDGIQLRTEDKGERSSALIESRYSERVTLVRIDRAVQDRWPQRLVKLFFGTRLLASGWMPFHAASVAFDGLGVLFCGTPGTGKSTFAHLASMYPDTALLSDDLTLVSRNQPLTLLGWPDRIAVPVSTLQATMPERLPELRGLRRSRLAPPSKDPINPGRVLRGERYAFDRREHRTLLGVRHGAAVPLGLIVLASCDPERRGEPLIGDVEPQGAQEELASHLAGPVDVRFLSDILGVFGRVPGPPANRPVERLVGVPMICMTWGVGLSNQRDAPRMIEEQLRRLAS